MPTIEKMRELARALAQSNKAEEPQISRAFWFPSTEELRMVEVDDTAIPSDEVIAFHFGPSPAAGLPVPFAIALIRSSEVKAIPLPEGWGSWDDAEEVDVCLESPA